jgi:hypothetical protein
VIVSQVGYDYEYRDARPGLQPGESMFWWATIDTKHDTPVLIDAVCHRGGDTWTVLIAADVDEPNESMENFLYRRN